MELREIVRRIGGQHWRLILAGFAVGVVGALLLGSGAATYTASARLVLDTQDPQSRPESVAIADTARAIATSPAQVTAALEAAGIRSRNPVDVAKHHVSVQALGTSAVLQLSATDRNPRVAADIANAIARRVIQTRLAVSKGQVQQTLTALNDRIDELTRQIADADTTIDSLALELATAPEDRANSLRTKRDAAVRNRGYLAQQRTILESERDSLLSANALRPNPSIISPAEVPLSRASHRSQELILGALLGLVLGVGLAGAAETFRPTFVGGDVLAREFGAPQLGTLAGSPDDPATLAEVPPVAHRIRLAAEASQVTHVAMVAAGGTALLDQLAERLNALQDLADESAATLRAVKTPRARAARNLPEFAGPSALPDRLRITPFRLETDSLYSVSHAGLVVVAPSSLGKHELDETANLVRLIGAPVLGLIAYKPTPSGGRSRALAALRGRVRDAELRLQLRWLGVKLRAKIGDVGGAGAGAESAVKSPFRAAR